MPSAWAEADGSTGSSSGGSGGSSCGSSYAAPPATAAATRAAGNGAAASFPRLAAAREPPQCRVGEGCPLAEREGQPTREPGTQRCLLPGA